MKKSLLALLVCLAVQIYFGHIFYPNYNEPHSNATIGWDVSGYYFYLPAIFIHHDLKSLSWKDEVLEKYRPTPNLQQAYLHDSGNYIMKYSIGQSFVYSPWFAIAHIWAKQSEKYPADGFSWPYQFMMSIGSLFISFLGLWMLRKILLFYYSEGVTAISLISLVLGTNYLEFSTISGAMAHNSLFTIYTLIIFSTIQFYKHPKHFWALAIGGLIGWAALIRPTEIIAVIIPIFWGLKSVSVQGIRNHWSFLINQWKFLIPAVGLTFIVGFIQLAYWKYAGGEWIIYSYQDQGFDWLGPHIKDCLFSYRTGWMIYTPIMFFGIIGLLFLFIQKKEGHLALILFAGIFTYLCFAWSEWWYGGSLSMRAMVQSYPVYIIAMASFYHYAFKARIGQLLFGALIILFCSYNLWLHRHAHKNGLLHAGNMTKAYFWKILGKNNVDKNALKLLDAEEEYDRIPQNAKLIFSNQFEETGDSICNNIQIIEGQRSLCLNKENQFSEKFNVVLDDTKQWARVSADFRILQKEWETWKMTQLIIRAHDDSSKILKTSLIRIQRLLDGGQTKNLYLDFSIPNSSKKLSIEFWNADGQKPIFIDNLRLEIFD